MPISSIFIIKLHDRSWDTYMVFFKVSLLVTLILICIYILVMSMRSFLTFKSFQCYILE